MTGAETATANFIGFETVHPDGSTTPNQRVIRGRGRLEVDDDALMFTRSVPKLEIRIPFTSISDISTGKSHNGKRVFGYPVIKVTHHSDEGDERILGLIVGRREVTERWVERINHRRARGG